MAKRPLPIRISTELFDRVDVARGDVSRTRWVERALESALSDGGFASSSEGRNWTPRKTADVVAAESVPQSSASSRASEPSPLVDDAGNRVVGDYPGVQRGARNVKTRDDFAMERQRKLNEGKG